MVRKFYVFRIVSISSHLVARGEHVSQSDGDDIRSKDKRDDLAVCPGEDDRYGDHKCNHDETHLVCAQLLEADGKPIEWKIKDSEAPISKIGDDEGNPGKNENPVQNFWDITGQSSFKWDDKIRANNGDSWCICMWATATLIKKVGCENVHLRCDATNVAEVLKRNDDAGQDIASVKECLKSKCENVAPVQDTNGGIHCHENKASKKDKKKNSTEECSSFLTTKP